MTGHLIARFTARPGSEEVVTDLLCDLTAQVRSEPGNVTFDAYTETERAGRYVVVEAYRDDVAFRDHLASEHSRAFNLRLRDLIEGDAPELTWLTPLDRSTRSPTALDSELVAGRANRWAALARPAVLPSPTADAPTADAPTADAPTADAPRRAR